MGPGESGNGKRETRNVMRRDAVRRFPFPACRFPALHDEGLIRTRGRALSSYNGFANLRLQPHGHLAICGAPYVVAITANPRPAPFGTAMGTDRMTLSRR